jgi:hypothetical protein
MSNLHPTIAQALEPFFQAIGAADPPDPPAQTDTPPPVKRPYRRVAWQTHGLTLQADVYIYKATYGRRNERGQPMDPDTPAGAEVQSVWLGRHDISPLLSEEVLRSIEDHAFRTETGGAGE